VHCNRACLVGLFAVVSLFGLVAPSGLAEIGFPNSGGEPFWTLPDVPFTTVPVYAADPAPDTIWTSVPSDEASEFTEAASAYDPNPVAKVGGTELASDEAALPLDETPTRTKVPEPAALVLVGTGLIGIASFVRLRRKR